jgi:hypothetical protein
VRGRRHGQFGHSGSLKLINSGSMVNEYLANGYNVTREKAKHWSGIVEKPLFRVL